MLLYIINIGIRYIVKKERIVVKVNYELKMPADIKELKETLKPFGGRCAKIVEDKLEYQIKEENAEAAVVALKEKGYIGG